MIGVVEILLILVAVFAAGRAFRNGPDLRRLIATALFAIAGVYGVVGLAWAFRWGFWPSGHPHRGAPGPSAMAMISVMCIMVAWFLIWLGVRVGRGGGLPGRFARAAGAAYREFFATTESVAKSKSAPDRDFFEA